MSSRDLFMKQKTESEIWAALSYFVTGAEALSAHIADCFDCDPAYVKVSFCPIVKILKAKDISKPEIPYLVNCHLAELPAILKEKSQQNYNALKQAEQPQKVHNKNLEDIRKRQFNANMSLKLKEPKDL